MSKKNLYLLAGATAIAVLLFTLFSKRSNSHDSIKIDPAFSAYISGFTSGTISNQSAIRIVLTNASATAQAGNKTEEKLFDFSPSLKGTTTWLDKYTIEFKPEKPLTSGQRYRVEFALSKVTNTPKNLETFEFDFETIKQWYDITIDGVKTTDKQTLKWQRLNGTLSTADFADTAAIHKTLSAVQKDKSLHISWEHENNTTHRFSIDSIQRTDEEGEVLIKWNGNALDVDNNGEKKFIIPALGDFKVLDVKAIQSPDQYISVQFSDPVLPNQNLDGLIFLNGRSTLKFISEDNEIRVYPAERLTGQRTITVETGVKNILGLPLKTAFNMELVFEDIKPEIRLNGKGVILPNSKGLIFPFQSVNLRAVDVKIVRVFENNIPQFLQVNNLDGSSEMRRVARTVLKKTVQLPVKTNVEYGHWNNYSLDLAELIKTEPGAIYKITLSYKKQYSTYHCDGSSDNEKNNLAEVEDDNDDEDETDDNWGSGYYYDYDYDYYDSDEEYDYNQRENPCHATYYRNKKVSRNVLASDIGIMAKKAGNNQLMVVTTDLLTAQPLGGVNVEIYDYQQQLIANVKSDNEGLCLINLKHKPFLVIVKNGTQRGYLKLDDGNSLSMSMFDVAGETVQKGIKGFIYGERGVWRPGDTLFLSFILEDKQKTLPAGHPVTMEIINPQGKLVKRTIKTNGLNGFYDFTTPMNQSDPTGNYQVKVKVGGVLFTKTLKIETVMPNRLKINFDIGNISILKKDVVAKLHTNWLTGATAHNLEAKVEVSLTQIPTIFKKYESYNFDDPARSFSSEPAMIFEGHTDNDGNANIPFTLNKADAAPGMLKAGFNIRVFEEGGAFSVDKFTIPYSPYDSYVGIKTPEGRGWSKTLNTDTMHTIEIATVDPDGKPVSRNKLKVQIYKIEWRWWWERYNYDLANYIGNNYHQPYQSLSASTVNGKGGFKFKVNESDWGRYLIHIVDEESGHSTGSTVYFNWPSWYGSSPKGNEGASLLSFTSDKPKYNVGETAKISIPSAEGGKIFLSVENGTKVLKTIWADAQKGQTEITFPITAEMTPNIYVYGNLLQPHAQTVNDLPIRLYGIIPVLVEDPATILKPVLKTAEVWKPEEKCSITVSEAQGKEMTYTIAVVDEGLLDLTRFKTPDPWSHFYAREALGVKSWDLFDMVMGAFGGELQRILAIGGDGEVNQKGGAKALRFKPLVRFMGPFTLSKGATKTHDFMMPQYVGSVRVMLIAGQNYAYGHADKAVPVRKPLMILPTLPRVIGPGETFDLPVSVFAMEKHVKNVSVSVSSNELLSVTDGNTKAISFKQPDDEVVSFKMKAKSALGIAKVKVTAVSGNEKATYDVEIDVRNPNPRITNVTEGIIEPGKTWDQKYTPAGIAGTNKGTLELSSIPPLNLEKRLGYLIQYPHGCIEQTTSSVFPQLYLGNVLELNSDQKARVERNIKSGLDRLRSFQVSGGGFAYWPGDYDANDWGSSYAGHFLVEAEKKGYSVPYGMLENWKKFQKQRAIAWNPHHNTDYDYYENNDLAQAYRLYTLALANTPELGAMNRLREYDKLSTAARWRLAAAYALAGQAETAKSLIKDQSLTVPKYRELDYTYGSDERDEAMILETLVLMDEKAKASQMLKEVASSLSSTEWMSTQTTAYCLIAVSKFIGTSGSSTGEMNYSCRINSTTPENINTKAPIKQYDLGMKGNAVSGNVSIANKGIGVLFVRIVTEGIPETGDQTEANNNLDMFVSYFDKQGKELNINEIEQGTDFFVEIKLFNSGTKGHYKQMALSAIFPSGWEIHNTHMDLVNTDTKSSIPTYQDIRDDRVYTYFDIRARETKTFRFGLNAAYIGKFYLPSIACEAMYDASINAHKGGKWVEVKKPGVN